METFSAEGGKLMFNRLRAEFSGLLQDRPLDEVVDFILSSVVSRKPGECLGEYAERIVKLSDALRRRSLQFTARKIESNQSILRIFNNTSDDLEEQEMRAICLYLTYIRRRYSGR